MHIERFEIDERFCGPPRSGNGGYTCGRVAARLAGSVAVRLMMPPPLATPLRLESDDDTARLFHTDALIGEARRAPLDLPLPAPPSYAAACEASRGYIGFTRHTFPGCFVCGPQREPGDGLRIFPGAVNGTATVASPWVPAASLADDAGGIGPEFIWAALDCSGAFAVMPVPEGTAVVLGELCATVDGTVRAGERAVVVGWPLGTDGRRRFAGTAVFGEDGRPIAHARAIWVEVPADAWA